MDHGVRVRLSVVVEPKQDHDYVTTPHLQMEEYLVLVKVLRAEVVEQLLVSCVLNDGTTNPIVATLGPPLKNIRSHFECFFKK